MAKQINSNSSKQLDVLKLIGEELLMIDERFKEQISLIDIISEHTEKMFKNFDAINDVNIESYITLQDILNIEKKSNNILSEQEDRQSKIHGELYQQSIILTSIEDTNKELIKSLTKQSEEQQKQTEELEKQKKLDDEKAKNEKEQEYLEKKRTKRWETFEKITGKIWQIAKDTYAEYAKTETVLRKMNAVYGMGNEGVKEYKKHMMSASVETLRAYNVGTEALTKWGTDFSAHTGKAMQFSKKSLVDMAALSRVIGDEGVSEMINVFDDFSLSVTTAFDNADKSSKLAQKNGLSVNKTITEVNKNMSYIDKYSFKNGVEGVRRMTVESMKFKMNFAEIAKFADKISSVEGSIKTAADLQVLGGSFAQMADPMSMLYESINDIEGLQKRVIESTANSMTLKDGVVQYKNGHERLRAEAAADSMGIDRAEFAKSARTTYTRKKIQGALDKKGFNEEQQNVVATNAGFSEKLNDWVVNIKGEDIALKNLNEDQVEYLKKAEEPLKSIADATMSLDEYITGGKSAVSMQLQKTTDGIAEGINARGMAKNIFEVISSSEIASLITVIGGTIVSSMLSNMVGKGYNSFKEGRIKRPSGGSSSPQKGTWSRNRKARKLKSARAKNSATARANTGGSNTGQSTRSLSGGLKNTFKNPKNFLKAGGAGLGLGLLGVGAGMGRNALLDSGKMDRGGVGDYATSAGTGALTGAAIGSLAGPIGTAVGAAVGAGLGLVSNKLNIGREKAGSRLGQIDDQEAFLAESNDEISLLKNIAGSAFEINMMLKKEFDVVDIKTETQKDSEKKWYHSLLGGITNIDDGIISKDGTVTKINNEDDVFAAKKGGPIYNAFEGANLGGNAETTTSNVNFKPLDVNFSGSIELKGNNGSTASIDVKELTNDPVFMKEFTRQVQKQINMDSNGGRKKGWAGRYNI